MKFIIGIRCDGCTELKKYSSVSCQKKKQWNFCFFHYVSVKTFLRQKFEKVHIFFSFSFRNCYRIFFLYVYYWMSPLKSQCLCSVNFFFILFCLQYWFWLISKSKTKKMKFRSKVLKSINKTSGNMIWKKKLSLLFSLYKIFYRFVNNSMFHVLSIIIIIIIIILKKRQEERIE